MAETTVTDTATGTRGAAMVDADRNVLFSHDILRVRDPPSCFTRAARYRIISRCFDTRCGERGGCATYDRADMNPVTIMAMTALDCDIDAVAAVARLRFR